MKSPSLHLQLITCINATLLFCGPAQAAEFVELSTYFAKANTASDPKTVDCTLSDGTKTKCFQITVKPAPKTHTPGPWCPENISDTADKGGIWLESGQVHDVTGAFIENMATFYSDNAWQLYDPETGKVRVTDTHESCAGAAKPNVEPEFQQHCVECQVEYVDANKTITYTIPLKPVTAKQPSETRSSGSGVAFDGVRLDGPAPVADILGNYTLAPFDDCGGHVNLHVGYHYHAATDCLDTAAAFTDHGKAVGLAMDGHLILARILNDGSTASDLDQCGGHTTAALGYHYHAGEQGSNQILGCLVAEYGCVSEDPDAQCDASVSAKKGPGGNGGPPDFAAAASKLGISEDALKSALGKPPLDVEKAADTLGISADALQKALSRP